MSVLLIGRVRAALNKEIIRFDLHETNARLSKLGGEINHLVVLCHQGKIKSVNMTKYTKELKETPSGSCNINRTQSTIKPFCTTSLIHMTNNDDGTACSLCNARKIFKNGSDFICPMHNAYLHQNLNKPVGDQ